MPSKSHTSVTKKTAETLLRPTRGDVVARTAGRAFAGHAVQVGRHRWPPCRFAAERFLVRTEADMERGAWQDPRLGRIMFAEWVEEYRASATHKRATTIARDHAVLEAHLLPAL